MSIRRTVLEASMIEEMDADRACADAIYLANMTNVGVSIVYDGIKIVAYPGDQAEAMIEAYYDAASSGATMVKLQ